MLDDAVDLPLIDALVASGHAVHRANQLIDGVGAISDGGIDVVVIRVDDASTVIEFARAVNALPDAPPVVLISGSPQAPELSARVGAAAFLAEPCDPHDVIETIHRLVGTVRPLRVFEDEPTGTTRQHP